MIFPLQVLPIPEAWVEAPPGGQAGNYREEDDSDRVLKTSLTSFTLFFILGAFKVASPVYHVSSLLRDPDFPGERHVTSAVTLRIMEDVWDVVYVTFTCWKLVKNLFRTLMPG